MGYPSTRGSWLPFFFPRVGVGKSLSEKGTKTQEAARDQVLMTQFDSLDPGMPITSIRLDFKIMSAS